MTNQDGMSVDEVREDLARKAYKLAKPNVGGTELAKLLGVQYASEARHLAAVGHQIAQREACALTEPELLLLRCLADEHRSLTRRGEYRSPSAPNVSWRARKSSGWAAATAAKRLGEYRKGEEGARFGTGLRMLSARRNGYMWLEPAGWAVVHAIEAAALRSRASSALSREVGKGVGRG